MDAVVRTFNRQLDRLQAPEFQRSVAFNLGNVSRSSLAASAPAIFVKGDSAPDVPQPPYPTTRQLHRANRQQMTPRQRQKQDANLRHRKVLAMQRATLHKLGKDTPDSTEPDAYTLALPLEYES
jgi:hypothetical protein